MDLDNETEKMDKDVVAGTSGSTVVEGRSTRVAGALTMVRRALAVIVPQLPSV